MADLESAAPATAHPHVERDIARGISVVAIMVAALAVVAIVFYLGFRWPAKDQPLSHG
ncbi:MAG: hypothetical protein WBA63_06260 [Thermomicrobiales bacterium]